MIPVSDSLPVLAQAAPAAGNPLASFIMIGFMFAAMWFLIIVPQRKKQKQHAKMLTELDAGDEIVTAGGIYGEITGKVAAGIRGGAPVSMGQVVGYMGKVSSGCCNPMLHFELYSGARTGSLSGGGKFRRRADLLDPTQYLRRWQETQFKPRR